MKTDRERIIELEAKVEYLTEMLLTQSNREYMNKIVSRRVTRRKRANRQFELAQFRNNEAGV